MPSMASQQAPVAACWVCPGGRVPSQWAPSEPGVESLGLCFQANLRCSRGGKVGVNPGPLFAQGALALRRVSFLPLCALCSLAVKLSSPLTRDSQRGASVEPARLRGSRQRQPAGMAKGSEV